MKRYEVTMYYCKSVIIEAENERDAVEKAHMGYGEQDSLNAAKDMDEVVEMID